MLLLNGLHQQHLLVVTQKERKMSSLTAILNNMGLDPVSFIYLCGFFVVAIHMVLALSVFTAALILWIRKGKE